MATVTEMKLTASTTFELEKVDETCTCSKHVFVHILLIVIDDDDDDDN